jgi:hypothetical protein
MKNYTLLLLLFVAAFFSGCEGKEEPVLTDNFTLTFRALYDGQPLEKYKNYPYADKTVQFDRFNIFLSDIVLLKGATEVKLSDIEWVDFTPDLAPDNKAVDVSFKYTVPNGHYTGIKIGYGVKPDLNAKKPADFAVDHPLYLENEYWSGWKSYIFAKVQGEVDLDGNDTTETNIFYHCGSDAVYNTGSVTQGFHVAGDESLVVEFDLKKLFTFDGQLLDLSVPSNQTTSHSASNIALGQKMMNNFKNAVVLE